MSYKIANTETIYTNGGRSFTFYRIDNDTNGNPRYVVHFLTLGIELADYGKRTPKIKRSGLAVYRAKWFGGGYVFQSYNLKSDANELEKIFFND